VDAATIARWRLANVGLEDPAFRSPAAVLSHLVATQAQDLLPGRWSLAQRCADVPTEAQVGRAHDDGAFLRVHTLRPTWHFVGAEDLPLVLAATSARVHQANRHMSGRTGVDEALMSHARGVLEQMLGDGAMTRPDVQRALDAAGIEAEGVRLAYVLMWAELEGWICSGPSQGSTQTYALVAERVPVWRTWDVHEAQAVIALRYLESRGPATVKDLAVWSSLTIAQARGAVESVKDQLENFEHEGRTYWFASEATDAAADDPVVSLVQTYDEVVMSYSESRDVLTGGAKLWDLPSRRFMHPVLVDGRLIGHWRFDRGRTGRPEAIALRLQRPLGAAETAAIEGEVKRFSTFAGRDVTWSR